MKDLQYRRLKPNSLVLNLRKVFLVLVILDLLLLGQLEEIDRGVDFCHSIVDVHIALQI